MEMIKLTVLIMLLWFINLEKSYAQFGHPTNTNGYNRVIGGHYVMNYIDQNNDHAMATISNIGDVTIFQGFTNTPDPIWSVKNSKHTVEWFSLIDHNGNASDLEV